MRATQFLDQTFYNNSVRQWGIALAVALASFLALLLLRRLLVGRLGAIAKRTTTELDDILVEMVGRTNPFFLAATAVVFGSRFLIFPPTTDRYFAAGFAIVLLVQCGLWGATAVDKFGVNVTTLVTGLGIGGVAIALAVQNVLGDLFAALSIVFDKPFDVGDSIAVDQMQGTVERIGLKTTRVRSVSGEQIIISNSELLKSRIRNYKRQLDRRVVFTTDVTYGTTPETVARIPGMVREVVSSQQPVRFDRSHFTQYTDSALRIETVYFVLDADYGRYLDIQQTINLELLRRFRAEQIELAFPTRTVVLEGVPLSPTTGHEPPRTVPQSSERIQPPSTAID